MRSAVALQALPASFFTALAEMARVPENRGVDVDGSYGRLIIVLIVYSGDGCGWLLWSIDNRVDNLFL